MNIKIIIWWCILGMASAWGCKKNSLKAGEDVGWSAY